MKRPTTSAELKNVGQGKAVPSPGLFVGAAQPVPQPFIRGLVVLGWLSLLRGREFLIKGFGWL